MFYSFKFLLLGGLGELGRQAVIQQLCSVNLWFHWG